MGEHEGAGGWGSFAAAWVQRSEAIAEAGRRHGMQVRTNAEVVKVEVVDDRVSKVVTIGGEEYSARAVVSNALLQGAVRTLDRTRPSARSVPEAHRDYRTFSTAFKINVAMNARRVTPRSTPRNAVLPHRITCTSAPTSNTSRPPTRMPARECTHGALHHCRRADDGRRYARASRQACRKPVRWPCAVRVGRAQLGRGAARVRAHRPTKRWTRWRRASATTSSRARCCCRRISNASSTLPHGHIFHGELALEQLFFQRPVPHYADYRSPVRGLYQCGSSTHPGGGVRHPGAQCGP